MLSHFSIVDHIPYLQPTPCPRSLVVPGQVEALLVTPWQSGHPSALGHGRRSSVRSQHEMQRTQADGCKRCSASGLPLHTGVSKIAGFTCNA